MKTIRFLSLGIACALVAALFVVTGCNPAGKDDGQLKLAFVTNMPAEFWSIARAGTQKADQEFDDVTVEFRMNPDNTAASQKSIIDDFIVKGVDGLAISPPDPKNQTQMLNKAAKSTLIVTQDSDAPESNRAFYLGTDNLAAGRQAAELIKEALPNGGKLMVFVGSLDQANAIDRLNGVKEGIKDSGLEIIDVNTDNGDQAKAKQNVADALVSHQDLAGVVGLFAYNGPAMLGAVKDAGKLGEIAIISFDEDEGTLQGIKDGHIHGTVVQQPFEFGYQAIKRMREYLKGDKSFIPESKRIYIPTKQIRKDNVEAFWAELDKLTGK